MTFYIAIPINYGGISSYYVYLTTLSDESISYTIKSLDAVVIEGEISSSAPSQQISLSESYIVKSYTHDYRHLGLRVQTSGPVTLVVVNYKSSAIGEYPAIPYETFNTSSFEYFAVSTGSLAKNNFGQILLVGNNDSTSVTVIPKVPIQTAADVQSDPSSLQDISAGIPKTFILHEFQTLLITSKGNNLDLTGSKIISDKPLTVVTGHQCGNIPSDTDFCENILEQIPPTVTWGKQFLLSPYKTRDGQFYKIVASKAYTTVKHNCINGESSVTLISSGSFTTIQTANGKYCYLEANHPVLATQMSPSNDFDGTGDPAISVVPPLERFTKATSFFIPQLSTINLAYLNIVTKEKATFYLDKSPLSTEWNIILDLDGNIIGFGTQVTSVNVNTAHNVTNSEDVDFYGIFYGFSTNTAFSLTTPGIIV